MRALTLEHDQRRHRRADIDDGDHRVFRHGELVGHELECVFHRERFDIHHTGGQSAEIESGHAQVDVLRARRGQQHVHHLRVVFHRTDDFKIETDFFERIRNVLIRFDLDLSFEIVFGQIGRHRNDFGDHSGARHGGRCEFRFRTRAIQRATDRFADGFHFNNIFFDDSIGRQRLDRVMLYTVLATGLTQLQQLYGRRADVHPNQRRRFYTE